MNNHLTKPDSLALIQTIKHVINENGIVYLYSNGKTNVQILADMGITCYTQKLLIEGLGVEDYYGTGNEFYHNDWQVVAGFYKRYQQFEVGIKISLSAYVEAPAVCLEFIPKRLL